MQDLEKIYFSSDQHFGHQTAVKRPPSTAWGKNTRHQFAGVNAMEQGMIDSWNLEVPEDGTVYVLGDFVYNGNKPENEPWMIEKTAKVLDELHGTKHLIVGNHDLPFNDESKIQAYQDCGFETVTKGKTMLELGSKTFELCHFPRWQGPRQRPEHYPEPITDWEQSPWLLHGHSHGRVQQNIAAKMIEVGVDAWSFRPVAATTIIGLALSAENHMSDQAHNYPTAPNTYTA